jgi:RHS repeat-associated protein
VAAISEGGTLRNTYRYDAFGKPIAQGGSSPLTNAYTYTGREFDASGLYYYRARYYLPSAGRFLTPDPIGLKGGLNAYTYVSSNPVNYTDPFGLMAGGAFSPAWPELPVSFNPTYDPAFNLEVRSYAPFESFAYALPPWTGFVGDDRGASTDFWASSRIHANTVLWPISQHASSTAVYSDLTRLASGPDWEGRAESEGYNISHGVENGVKVFLEYRGSDPLYFGYAPDINVQANASVQVYRSMDMMRIEFEASGDAFPNLDAVLRDSSGRGLLIHSFESSLGPNTGPASLWFNKSLDMGHSVRWVPLTEEGNFRCPPACR